MCAPSRPSYSPPPAPTPAPTAVTESKKVRRIGKTLRTSSPSQRGRGVLIKSKNPLGIASKNPLGTRQSLLLPMTEYNVTVGGY